MGDIIDDFLEIRKEFDGMKDEFDDTKRDISGKPKREVVEIWDASRYRVTLGIEQRLCLHSCWEESDCTECTDICPVEALTLDEGDLSIDGKECIGCGLCVTVCPTSALSASRIDPKRLYDQIAAAASSGEAAYVTCAQAIKRTPPAGVIVLPCLGVMRTELWFSLLAAYDNIGIYLPLHACERCASPAGEELYGEAVEQAEQWARETVGFECLEKDLRTDKRHSAERAEFMRDILKSTVSVAGNVNPVTRKVSQAYRALDKHRNDLTGIQNVLNRMCGESAAQAQVQLTLEPNRQLMLSALKSYRDLADDIRIVLSKTTEECDGCGKCVYVCPMGARTIQEGRAEVTSAYCVGCGLCTEVCPKEAAVLRRRRAKVLLREMTELEQRLDALKDKAGQTADVIKGKAKKSADGPGRG